MKFCFQSEWATDARRSALVSVVGAAARITLAPLCRTGGWDSSAERGTATADAGVLRRPPGERCLPSPAGSSKVAMTEELSLVVEGGITARAPRQAEKRFRFINSQRLEVMRAGVRRSEVISSLEGLDAGVKFSRQEQPRFLRAHRTRHGCRAKRRAGGCRAAPGRPRRAVPQTRGRWSYAAAGGAWAVASFRCRRDRSTSPVYDLDAQNHRGLCSQTFKREATGKCSAPPSIAAEQAFTGRRVARR